MDVLLTERQKFMLRDLLNEEKSITAKILAERYSVSLRTVRYDLDNIEYWLKERGASLSKIPRNGMLVKNKEKALESIKNMSFNTGDILLSSKERENIIILKLILTNKATTSEKFAEELHVSRGTIITEIRKVNKELRKYSISIQGKTNHGFLLVGEEKYIRKFIGNIFVPLIVNDFKDKFYSISKDMFQAEDIDMANKVIDHLKKHSDIRLGDTQILKFKLILLIRRIKCGNILPQNQEAIARYKTTKIYNQVKSAYMVLVNGYDIPFKESEVLCFLYTILSEGIDISAIDEVSFDDKKLANVIDEIVSTGCNYLDIKKSEIQVLSHELFEHLKITLNKVELNVMDENPILEQIKAQYGDVFAVIKKACAAFRNAYGFELSEGEIGFITLYFLKSLEKSKECVKKSIVIVCNTSRGTSKLLATRIKNNISEVNVKSIASLVDIENDKKLIKNVDLVISTIKIDNLNKPCIIVSPIITNYELTKIRDFLYLNEDPEKVITNEENYIEDTLTSIIEKHTPKENVNKLRKEIMNLIGSYINTANKSKDEKEALSEQAELICLILVELSDMILKLYPDGLDRESFRKIFGIIIHVIMSINRWQNGQYIQEKNIKVYEQKYPRKFKIIEETFNRISEKYKIPIKRAEVVAVLRYLI